MSSRARRRADILVTTLSANLYAALRRSGKGRSRLGEAVRAVMEQGALERECALLHVVPTRDARSDGIERVAATIDRRLRLRGALLVNALVLASLFRNRSAPNFAYVAARLRSMES
jgi:hypothetical protein